MMPTFGPIVSTITIPCMNQPNFLHATLHGLVRHSVRRHRIIVVWSDPLEVAAGTGLPSPGPAADWEVGGGEDVDPQPVKSVRALLDSHAGWMREHGVEALDVTARTIDFFRRFVARQIPGHETGLHPDSGGPHGGVDIALKNNIGLEITDTEWTIPNWDADFFPAPGWDHSIFEYAPGRSGAREYLVPMHAQPVLVSPERAAQAAAGDWDPWRESPSCHRMAIATSKNWRGCKWVTAADVASFAARHAKDGRQIRERCGARSRLHWVPWILPTGALKQAGGFSHMGPGYDLELDDRFGAMGYTKIGFEDSFIVHKGYVPSAELCDL